MKQIYLKFSMLLLCLVVGLSSAWGEEEVAYTLTPAVGSNGTYAGNCDVKVSDITWNITGNASLTPWRLGGKSITGVDRAIYSKTAIADNITSIVVTNGTASSITVNSFTLTVASDASFSDVISTVTGTFAASGTTTFTRPEGADWTGRYYKFTYNVTVSGSNNKFVQFSGAVFNKEKTGGETTTVAKPTISYTNKVSDGVIYPNSEVSLACTTDDATIKYRVDISNGGIALEGLERTYSAPFTVSAQRNYITAWAEKDGVKSEEATLTLTKATLYTLDELVAADITSGTTVVVSFENLPIKSIFTTTQGYRNGIYFDIQKDDKDIEIFYQNVPAEWVVGGTVSGTMICPWTNFNGTWELAPAKDSWSWDKLTYTAPAVVKTTPTISITPKDVLDINGKDTYDVTYNGDGTLSVKSSNEAVATVSIEGNKITVTPVASGTTAITISAPETANYYAVEEAYRLAVVAPADLPFSFDGGVSDIANTTGMSHIGLGSDYSASPKLKFNDSDDYVIIYYGEDAKKVTFTAKGNGDASKSLPWAGQFDVMESVDGKTYTTVMSQTDLTSTATEYTADLSAASRYVKFVYTSKTTGNVALGAIKIVAAGELEDPELAFEKTSYAFLTTDENKKVVASSAKSSTGAITYALTEGDENAFLIDESTGDIVCETVGTYTVTATITADDNYSSKTATTTVTISAPVEANPVALVAQYGEKYYAMAHDFSAVEVSIKDDKAYVVEPLKANITWNMNTVGVETTFQTSDGYLSAPSKTTLKLVDTPFAWTYYSEAQTWSAKVNTTERSFIYGAEANVFKAFAISNVGNEGYSYQALAYEIVSVNGYSRSVTAGKYGTICLPNSVETYFGATFYNATINGSAVELTEVTALEAGKPYIFLADASTIACVYEDNTTSTAGTNGPLVGTLTGVQVPVGSYVMQTKDGVQKFYKVAEGAQPTLSANKAYLTVPASGAKVLNIGSAEETAIKALDAIVNNSTKIYDVNGREIKTLQKGVNIVNGIKVLVK